MKVLPRPGVLSSVISPPSNLASSRLMARPRPVPPYLREVLPSACWNASKITRCLSSGMPMPVSLTRNATTPGARPSAGWSLLQPCVTGVASSMTVPFSVNLKAFDSRFFRI